MEWEEILDRYGEMIEKGLRDYFLRVRKEAGDYHPLIAKVYSDLEEFICRRGKRLASVSALLTYDGYTGRVDEQILNVCIGLEIYRHCILIHDDLVDMDDLRRGGRTMHKILMTDYDSRFGESSAMFLGNIAFSLALQQISSSGFPEDKIAKSLLLLSKGYEEVNESQILDLLFEYKNVEINEWRIMASRRAASLFRTVILIGAILGGSAEPDLRILESAAINMGYSFDIQDDIIDTFANEKQYGRPPCGDIASGKKPLHVILTLKHADQGETMALKNLLGKKSLAEGDINLIRKVIRESGGLEAAKNMSRKHAEEARALISQTSIHRNVKDFFISVIAYIEESLDWYR